MLRRPSPRQLPHLFLLLLPLFLTLLAVVPCAATVEGQTLAEETSIAYFIQISEASLTLLPRLLRVVWHPRNLYVIHFDRKIPPFQRSHAKAALYRGSGTRYVPNVRILPSEVVTYRGISMVLNLLSAMQNAIDADADWTFFINISGSDYPLVSPLALRRLLARSNFVSASRSFFSFAEPEWWRESKVFRYDRLFTDTSLSFNESESQVIDSYTEQPLAKIHNFTFTAAEAWMILHRDFVHHLLTSSDARRLLLSFSYSLEPEEHYFSTVAYNNPIFNASNVPHALRYVAWIHEGVHAGQHPYYIDQQDEDGKTWTFRVKVENSGCIFARKVRIQDSGFLTYIDTHMNGMAETPNDKDVTDNFERTARSLDCLARLNSGDDSSICFFRKD